MPPDFTIVLRGYERREVESLLERATQALTAPSDIQRAAARDALRTAEFPIALRGYDRSQVDDAVQALLRQFESSAASDEISVTLGSVLRLSQPTDQQIVDEVRRLRALADQHNL